MAVTFTTTTGERFTGVEVVDDTTPQPITLAWWGRIIGHNAGGQNDVFHNSETAATNPRYAVSIDDEGAAGNTRIQLYSGATSAVDLGEAISLDTWYHFCVTWATGSPGTIEAFLNGVSKGTTSLTAGGIDFATLAVVGGWVNISNVEWNGSLAELGVWGTVLSDNDILTLAAGYSPRLVQPQNLKAYVPMLAEGGTEPDGYSNASWTAVNTPTVADHPPQVTWKKRRRSPALAVAAAGGADATGGVWYQHHRRMTLF